METAMMDTKLEGNAPQATPPRYHSFLLRFWEERSEEHAPVIWRFSLEDPLTDQRYGFASLEALNDWIKAQITK